MKKRLDLGGVTIPENIEQMSKIMTETPQKQWPGLILMMFEGDADPKTLTFTSGGRSALPKYDRKVRLELCYEWLTQFGYQMSDEEIQMMGGTHTVFQEEIKA